MMKVTVMMWAALTEIKGVVHTILPWVQPMVTLVPSERMAEAFRISCVRQQQVTLGCLSDTLAQFSLAQSSCRIICHRWCSASVLQMC